MDRTKVIFRVLDSGEVIALFPELPGTYDPDTCQSYMHVGQHGAATPPLGRPAKRDDYLPLFRELEGIGYALDVRKRITRADRDARVRAINAR